MFYYKSSTSNVAGPPDLQLKFFLHKNKSGQNIFVKLNAVPVLNVFKDRPISRKKEVSKTHSNTCMPTQMYSMVHWDVWAHRVVHCDVGGGHLTDGASYLPG